MRMSIKHTTHTSTRRVIGVRRVMPIMVRIMIPLVVTISTIMLVVFLILDSITMIGLLLIYAYHVYDFGSSCTSRLRLRLRLLLLRLALVGGKWQLFDPARPAEAARQRHPTEPVCGLTRSLRGSAAAGLAKGRVCLTLRNAASLRFAHNLAADCSREWRRRWRRTAKQTLKQILPAKQILKQILSAAPVSGQAPRKCSRKCLKKYTPDRCSVMLTCQRPNSAKQMPMLNSQRLAATQRVRHKRHFATLGAQCSPTMPSILQWKSERASDSTRGGATDKDKASEGARKAQESKRHQATASKRQHED